MLIKVARFHIKDGKVIEGIHENISGDVNSIRGDVSNIRGDVSDICGNVSNINGNVSGIRGDVIGISGDVSNIWGNVSRLRGDVSDIVGNIDACELTKYTNVSDLIQPEVKVKKPVTIELRYELTDEQLETVKKKLLEAGEKFTVYQR